MTDIKEVVAGLFRDGDRFFIAQRPAHKARGLLWEFVGGKVEPGETKEEALLRECREELGVPVSVGHEWMSLTHVYPDLTIRLTLFTAAFRGKPQKLEHADFRWITVDEIDNYDFCPADADILARLKADTAAIREVRTGGRVLHEGRILTLIEDDVRLPDGTFGKREVVRHPGGVCVAPLTKEGDLIFVRQWRYPYDEETRELPAGKLARGENPDEAAARELSEETGAEGTLVKVGEMYPSPGYTDEIIRLYVATDLRYGDKHTDEDEFILTERIPLSVAVDLVMSGALKDAKTCQLVLMLDKLKRQDEG